MQINSIIIDDEPLSREGIEEYSKQVPFINIIGSYEHPLAAAETLKNYDITLIFLDIEMPVMTGLDFLTSLDDPPITIIITAYPEFAVKGFELNVFDYLLKPVPFNRFLTACNRAADYYNMRSKDSKRIDDYFFIKSDLKYHKIVIDEIKYVEAKQNYVAIYTDTAKHTAHHTMKYMESILPGDKFIRIHKSYLINMQHVKAIEGSAVHIGKDVLPISREKKMKSSIRY